MALKVTAQEVMMALNNRSASGRVVVNPPSKMEPMKLHDTESMHFCCGIAFLTEESLLKHQQEAKEHTKPIDMNNVRRALNTRSSSAFWRMAKSEAAKRFDEDGEEMEQQDEDKEENEALGNVNEHDENGEGEDEQDDQQDEVEADVKPNIKPPPRKISARRRKGWTRSKKVSFSTKRRRKGKINCEYCQLDIPASNISRHLKTCHNPSHEFPCRYCACRFEVAYGRMVHEVKNHPANVAAHGPSRVRTTLNVKRRMVVKPPPKIKEEPFGMINAKQLVPSMTLEEQANRDSNIRRVGKGEKGSKARFECTICNKTFLGSRNAQDHQNSHTGLKPYKCPLCDYYFSFRSNVVRHMKTCHTEKSDFVCPYGCGCCMQSDTSLKVHMNLICTLRHQYQNLGSNASRSPMRSAPLNVSHPPILRANPNSHLQRMSSTSISQEPAEDARLGTRVLKEKFQQHEVSPGIYRCEQCNKTITGSGNFRDHLNIHANIKPHKCPLCYMRFTFKSNIKRHLASAHVPNGRLKCPMKCGCTMDNQHALQSHLNKCKIEIVKYRQSERTAPVKIKQEIGSPPKARIYPPPPLLKKIMPRPPPLTPAPTYTASPQRPSSPDDSEQIGKYQCDVCGKSVSCKRNLSNHMLIHANVKPCKCLICGLHFRTLDTLKKHKVKSHGSNSPYKCSLCTCKFSQLQGLTMHTNIHHKSKAIKTEGSSSPSKSSLKSDPPPPDLEMEQVDDMDEVDEMEDEIGQIVTPRVNLAKARTKDGNWKCHLCGKILKKPMHLQAHMRIHSGEKPFKCPMCGFRFRLASTLYDHKKSSHRGGSFKCNLCTCAFETNLGLSRHKGIFHNSQANDYLQRKIRLIRDKAVKSAVQSRRPFEGMKPISFQQSTSPPKLSGETSILETRLNIPPPRLTKQTVTAPHTLQKPQPSSRFIKPSMEKASTSSTRTSGMTFQCGHCSLALPSLNALSEHQKVHRNMKPVLQKQPPALLRMEPGPSPRSCPICHQSIHGRTHYTKHMSGCHSGGPHRCDFCPCTFDSQGNLSRHHTLMHPNIRHSSNTGNGPSTSTSSFSHPNSNVHGANDETEDTYDESYEQGEEDQYESYDQNQGQYESYDQGQYESYEQDQDDQYESYERDLDEQQQWELSQVEATYSNVADDDANVPYEITSTGKLYTCPDCGKTFDKMNRYKLHVTVHSNVKPYKCPHCRQMFRLPGILATHIKKSHGSGQFRCRVCPSRFTSAKGLSVHEFVYHKGGRLERSVGREQQVLKPKKPAKKVVPKPTRFPTPISVPKVTSVFSHSILARSSPHPKPPAPAVKLPVMLPNPRPVKLKCHICAQIFFGTTTFQEHMKEHSSQATRSIPAQGTSQRFQQPVAQSRAQTTSNTYSQNYQHFQRGRTLNSTRGSNVANTTTSSGQGLYEEEEEQEQGTFQIVGYENGYEHEDVEMEEDNTGIEYGYEEQPVQQEYYEEVEEDNYDYINADDHLEIVHEDSSFGNDNYDDTNNEDYGVEIEMHEDNSQEEYWTSENQTVQTTYGGLEFQHIFCKHCAVTFNTRDSFSTHLNQISPTPGSHVCSYCCVPDLTVDELPDHIDQMHPMDEIEVIEAQVYGDP